MEKYEVFKSEGGFRVCLGVYLNSPVISRSPWFETEEQADRFAFDSKFDDDVRECGAFYMDGSWMYVISGDFYAADNEEQAKSSVIRAISGMGYDVDYILKRRKDLLI